MEDITPAILNNLQICFKRKYNANSKAAALLERVEKGTATYQDANDFAIEVGEILADVFGNNFSSAALPDGRMYYNIADETVRPMLINNYDIISDVGANVETALNRAAGIGIKGIKAPLHEDKVQGILDIISGKDIFDEIAYMLGEPVVNFSQTIIDDTIKTNAEFHSGAGMRPKVTRTALSDCCEWCQEKAGEYRYPDIPDFVYQRHRACRCSIIYDPGDGKIRKK